MSRAVMQQALEALELLCPMQPHTQAIRDAAIIALKQAVAEPEQPMAWMQEMPVSGNEERSVRMTTVKMVADDWDNPIPLYLAPTPQPEQPVACNNTFSCRCPKHFAAPPQREHITDGSPCWCNPDVIEEDGGNVIVHNYEDNWQQYAKPGETAQQCIERHRGEQDALMKLYATPRKPLTDEEISELLTLHHGWLELARAVERAHGITGEQHE